MFRKSKFTYAKVVSAVILSLLCFGCASVLPVKSKPPAKSVTVLEPFEWGDGIVTIFYEYPAGEYRPMYEDEDGFFYQAPCRISGRDTFMPLLKEGGLYWKKKDPKPMHVYIISEHGVPSMIGIGNRAKLKINK